VEPRSPSGVATSRSKAYGIGGAGTVDGA